MCADYKVRFYCPGMHTKCPRRRRLSQIKKQTPHKEKQEHENEKSEHDQWTKPKYREQFASQNEWYKKFSEKQSHRNHNSVHQEKRIQSAMTAAGGHRLWIS